ncbi:MAG: amidohydrolase [Deltaproteobacteria bacterium]|nr:amidohydrolase [Deltaproteobacteria bacterium]
MPTADLLLHGGRVGAQPLTPRHDAQSPPANAVAIADSHILAVGTENDLRPFVTTRTRLLSCAGHTILPGFIDPHLHLFAWASRLCGVDLSGARSLADLHAALTQRRATLADGAWLRGYGYDEFLLAEKRHPTRQDLDAVSRQHPILVRHRTGHAAVLNSMALHHARIDQHFVPPSGSIVAHDASGEPTGVLYELEAYLRTVIPPLAQAEFMDGVRQTSNALVRLGVTSFHDASAGNTVDDVEDFQRLRTEGILKSDATVMVGIAALPQLLASRRASFNNADRVRIGSIKIMVHEGRGEIYPPPEELRDMVWRVHQSGRQVAIHAVEEGAVWAALDAIEQAQRRLPRRDHRHRIEHCALCPPPLLEKLVETGSAVVTQPGFLHFHGEKYAAEVDPDRHEWLYRTKSLLTRGIPVAGSSDCPIAPLAPLVSLQTTITRQSRGGVVLGPQERLSLAEAVPLFTTAGAWIGFAENSTGSISPGKRADLVILDGDVVTTPTEALHALKVTTTIVGGEIMWSDSWGQM